MSPLFLQVEVMQTKFRDSLVCSFFLSHFGYFSFSELEMIELCLLSLKVLIIYLSYYYLLNLNLQ